jgi:hypothetical protein
LYWIHGLDDRHGSQEQDHDPPENICRVLTAPRFFLVQGLEHAHRVFLAKYAGLFPSGFILYGFLPKEES